MDIINTAKEMLYAMFGKEDSVWSAFLGQFGSIGSLIAQFVPYVCMALCVVCIFFGKKCMPFLKVVGFFVVGFIASLYFLIPILGKIEFYANLPVFVDYIVAGVIALVAAIFNKILYYVVYIGGFGGGAFFALWSGMVVTKVAGIVVKGNWIIGAVAGVVVAALALLLRKFIEKLGTAAFGATWIFLLLRSNFDFIWDAYAAGWTAFLQVMLKWLIIGIITLIGLIFQMATNRRKKV